jgi:hypothetical protein
MEIQLFAGAISLGKVNSTIIDDAMGVVGGLLEPSTAYHEKFQSFFRLHTEKSDWEKLAQLDVKAVLETGEILSCVGGICVTDTEEIPKVSVEFCGLSQRTLQLFRRQNA